MTIAVPPTREEAPPRRSFVERPLMQLILARMREFYREPEAVFWVYVFPILMVLALGIAFRNQPVEQIHVDVESGPQSASVVASLAANPRFVVTTGDADQCRTRLRTGKTQLVVSAATSPMGVTQNDYWFDRSRPESVLARDAVDDALQRAAGRRRPAQDAGLCAHRARGTLHRLSRSRPVGHEPDGRAGCGVSVM